MSAHIASYVGNAYSNVLGMSDKLLGMGISPKLLLEEMGRQFDDLGLRNSALAHSSLAKDGPSGIPQTITLAQNSAGFERG